MLKHFENKKSARERKAGKLVPSLARSAKTPLFRVFVSLQFSSSSSSYHPHPFAGYDILFFQSASWSNSKSTQPSVCRKICDFKCVLGSSTKYLLRFHWFGRIMCCTSLNFFQWYSINLLQTRVDISSRCSPKVHPPKKQMDQISLLELIFIGLVSEW